MEIYTFDERAHIQAFDGKINMMLNFPPSAESLECQD